MDPRLKQRLVGAAVLLALAVIFLPMLLDGGGRDTQISLREAIPPEPEFARPETAPPITLGSPETPAPAETRPQPRSEVRSVPEPQTLPERPAIVPEQRAAPSTPTTGGPSSDDAATPGGFAVQVGSFGEEANARSERDRLRGLGFTAFVEPARAEGRAFYRVKVGPVPERAEAERLRDRVQAQASLQGIVVTHP